VKVSINAGGREVSIETGSEANLTPDSLGDAALRIWQATDGAKPDSEGPGFGLQVERRQRNADPAHLGNGGMWDVKA